MALDAMAVNHMKIKAAGEKNPKAFMKSIKRGTRRRALIYQDAHPKKGDAQDNYKLADMMTHSPTNPRNYTAWARDLALRQMKKGAHSPIESQREKFTPIYEDLKNHKETPNTRKVMEEAIDRIKDIEKERETQSRHYIHLRPTISQGRNNPYKYTD